MKEQDLLKKILNPLSRSCNCPKQLQKERFFSIATYGLQTLDHVSLSKVLFKKNKVIFCVSRFKACLGTKILFFEIDHKPSTTVCWYFAWSWRAIWHILTKVKKIRFFNDYLNCNDLMWQCLVPSRESGSKYYLKIFW